jgi:YVTN family beta-propeller protein
MKRNLCVSAVVGLALAIGVGVVAAETAKYHELKKIAVGGEGFWDYLTCDSNAHRLYVSRGTHVAVVDLEKGAVAGDIPNTAGVHGIALGARRSHRGYTSNGRDNSVTVFDTETLKEVEKVKVGMGPDCIIYDRASKRVFTFNGGSNDATAIDVDTNQVAGTIALGGRPEYAVSDRNGEVFVNIEDKNEIVAIDSKALTVKNRWPIAPGDGPSGLAMDVKNRRLFAVCGNEKMVVMDADTGKVVATPTIGKGPDAAVFDAQNGLAFSSNGQDGTLTVIKEESPDKFTVEATVPTAPGARTMALDTSTHNILLATAKFQPAPAAEAGGQRRRPTMEPNSFVILVYGP